MGAGEYKGVSRRTVFRAGAVGTMATVGAVSGAMPAEASDRGAGSRPAGDLILFNGKIHTMAGRIAEVLAIHNGRIVQAGNELAAARRAAPDHVKLINLRGRTAIPGIIDNHNHLVLMGNRPGHHTLLENAYSIADVARTYRDRAEQGSSRRVHHHDRRLPLQPVPRGTAADAVRTGQCGTESPRVRLSRLQRAVGDQQPRLGERGLGMPHLRREALLALYTRANGWFLGGPDGHRLGTLEEGRLGDVAVLDHDYFTVPDEASARSPGAHSGWRQDRS